MPGKAVQWRVEGRAWSRRFEAQVVGAAFVTLLALAQGGLTAEAADGSAWPAFAQGQADGRGWPPAAIIAVPAAGLLGGVSTGAQSITCVQTPVAVDAGGRSGVLAPQVGVTVIRGAAASPSLTWVVVPAGQPGSDRQVAVTVCTPAR